MADGRPADGRLADGNRPVPHKWAVLAILCISLLVVSLDTTILNVAIPDIIRSMHASSSDLQWVVDVYAVVFAGLLLVFGNLVTASDGSGSWSPASPSSASAPRPPRSPGTRPTW